MIIVRIAVIVVVVVLQLFSCTIYNYCTDCCHNKFINFNNLIKKNCLSLTHTHTGDMAASQVKGLTEEITAIVLNARPERGDRVSKIIKMKIIMDTIERNKLNRRVEHMQTQIQYRQISNNQCKYDAEISDDIHLLLIILFFTFTIFSHLYFRLSIFLSSSFLIFQLFSRW